MKASSCKFRFVSLLGGNTEGRWKETKHATNIHSPVTKTVIQKKTTTEADITAPRFPYPTDARYRRKKPPSSTSHPPSMHGFLNGTYIANKIVAGYVLICIVLHHILKTTRNYRISTPLPPNVLLITFYDGFSPASLSNVHFLKPIPLQPPQRCS